MGEDENEYLEEEVAVLDPAFDPKKEDPEDPEE